MQDREKKGHSRKNYKMPEGFHVEIDRRASEVIISVSGVISINELERDFCVLKVRRGRIGIRGSAINVSVFENSAVKVSGKITEVTLI